MVINLPGMWATVAQDHANFVDKRIEYFLKVEYPALPRPMPQAYGIVASFLRQYRKVIAAPYKTDFVRLVKKYDRRFPPGSALRDAMKRIFDRVLDYKSFTQPTPLLWNAYKLCAQARWAICPYCHLVGTETYGDGTPNSGSHRGQLDHFFNKSEYPFLNLTLGNLVLACPKCNGPGFKWDKNFAKDPHLHPLQDRENVRFELRAKDPLKASDPFISNYRGELEDYTLNAAPRTPCLRTDQSIATFKLDVLYTPYISAARRIAQGLVRQWSSAEPSSREKMVQNATGLSVEDHGCDFNPNLKHSYRRVPAGRMQLDIYQTTSAQIAQATTSIKNDCTS